MAGRQQARHRLSTQQSSSYLRTSIDGGLQRFSVVDSMVLRMETGKHVRCSRVLLLGEQFGRKDSFKFSLDYGGGGALAVVHKDWHYGMSSLETAPCVL